MREGNREREREREREKGMWQTKKREERRKIDLEENDRKKEQKEGCDNDFAKEVRKEKTEILSQINWKGTEKQRHEKWKRERERIRKLEKKYVLAQTFRYEQYVTQDQFFSWLFIHSYEVNVQSCLSQDLNSGRQFHFKQTLEKTFFQECLKHILNQTK